MNCPFCKEEIVETLQASGPARRSARTNDFSFCADCGEWAVLESGDLRKPTDADYEFIAANPDARRIRELWVQAQRDAETLAQAWEDFLRTMPKLPPRGRQLCEASFMAGAFSFYSLQRAAAQENGGDARARTELLRMELMMYAEGKAEEESR